MTEYVKKSDWLLGIVGGVIGGTLGYFAFFFFVQEGFYTLVLPGTLLGLGCGWLSGMKSKAIQSRAINL